MGLTVEKNQSFAEYFKFLRSQKRITLRKFCIKAEADPGNISKMERGLIKPPHDHNILERYAKALDLNKGDDEWYLFFDLAAANSGIIPRDLMSDEEVLKVLPNFFRALRGQKPTEKELLNLVEKIRNSWSHMDYSKFKSPYFSIIDIRRIADENRERYWHNKDLPIEVEDILTFDFDIEIIPISSIRNGIGDIQQNYFILAIYI